MIIPKEELRRFLLWFNQTQTLAKKMPSGQATICTQFQGTMFRFDRSGCVVSTSLFTDKIAYAKTNTTPEVRLSEMLNLQ